MCCWISGSAYAQQPAPLSPEERRLILKALIDRDAAQAKVKELSGQLAIVDDQAKLAAERLQLERALRLGEKKLHLDALLALREYRTTRRPLAIKILTLGIVRDKHDNKLEANIAALQKEIMDWK